VCDVGGGSSEVTCRFTTLSTPPEPSEKTSALQGHCCVGEWKATQIMCLLQISDKVFVWRKKTPRNFNFQLLTINVLISVISRVSFQFQENVLVANYCGVFHLPKDCSSISAATHITSLPEDFVFIVNCELTIG